MDFVKQQLRRLGEVKAGLLLMAIGAVLGIIFARVFKSFYQGNINILDKDYLYQIRTASIDYKLLLKYVYWDLFKNFILFWMVCVTSLGIPFICLCLVYIGFQGSFFISVILMEYHFKGLLLIFGYTFPQYLIYIPVALISLRCAFWLCKSLRYDMTSKKGKREKIGKYMFLVILLGMVLALGGLSEAYIGSYIIRKILYFF
ncbi:stage II sporulation protein M [Clostridium sp. KNHs205]|uniref:stage II sporulation protein M n=1 Tax=Clostridium sp. KNHs205 TaxID=1449050 RepID=UPI00051B3991|nr:stage II sporulation protein M [Clostridium sp. KNHs205]